MSRCIWMSSQLCSLCLSSLGMLYSYYSILDSLMKVFEGKSTIAAVGSLRKVPHRSWLNNRKKSFKQRSFDATKIMCICSNQYFVWYSNSNLKSTNISLCLKRIGCFFHISHPHTSHHVFSATTQHYLHTTIWLCSPSDCTQCSW